MADLKPCPFCGGNAELIKDHWNGIVYVKCKECDCRCGRIGVSEDYSATDKAVEAWNKRKSHGLTSRKKKRERKV